MEDPTSTPPPPGPIEEWPGYITHRTRSKQSDLILIDRARTGQKDPATHIRNRWLVLDTETQSGHAFSTRKKAETALEILWDAIAIPSPTPGDTRANDTNTTNISTRLQAALESSFDCAEISEWLRTLCTAEKMVTGNTKDDGDTECIPVPDTGPRERGLRLLLSYFVGRELPRDETNQPTVRTVEEIEERLRTDEVYRKAMIELVGSVNS